VARDRGLEAMVGFVLARNDSMLRLCAEMGFAILPDHDDPLSRQVLLDLRPGA
jgi:hypothetical protein